MSETAETDRQLPEPVLDPRDPRTIQKPVLDPEDPRTLLQTRVRSALLALPGDFSFENPIAGVNATDLFNLNTLLGASIEVEVVRTLNSLRDMWDPDNDWLGYRFERSSQAFPDVRLVRRDAGDPVVALGIELKGWWLLSKEGVPSLRFQVAPNACAPHDLICVVPWHLSNAVAGVAQVIEPWVESARYAAEYRDHWWQHVRRTAGDAGITYPPNAAPYPNKADLVLAVPSQDGGGNYGRLPRAVGLMDDFIDRSKQHEILGIAVLDWILFLRRHSDTALPGDIQAALQVELTRHLNVVAPEAAEELLNLLNQINDILKP